MKVVVEDGRNELLLSAASSWEIAIKFALGRLPLPQPPAKFVPDRIPSSGVTPIAIEHAHVLAVAELPLHHRDPFDRLLIAQARALSVPVMTVDSAFNDYDVDVIKIGERP
ncbi:MAG TPA: type II toxin-antitoxin system VapC family toxin [Trueperaceae bacterium]|nr:type II toxin-antitoxin system VapC family toxin [Trueperaceae bacterium]